MYISRFIVFSALLFAASFAYASSHIAQLVFITEPQSIAVGAISGEIKIQLQDSAGAPTSPSETADVTFTSTSETGEFLNSSGNPVTLTWNSNWTSRTFYYRDTASGNYALTIAVIGRNSGAVWTAEQIITVGSGGAEQSEEGDTAPSVTEESSTGTYVSEPKKTITVDAGPAKQTAIAGANVAFSGSVYGLEGELVSGARYLWNFGDGSTQEGKSVAHMYAYPGEYVVVLEGSSGGYAAGDKMLVTVVPADIAINSIGEPNDFFVSLKNDTKQEINLEGWVLQAGMGRFMIPKNTRIASGKTIKFSPQITKLLYSPNVSLLFPNGRIASAYTPHNQVVSTPTPAPVVSLNIQKVNSVATEAEPILPESLQGVEEVSMAAAIAENGTDASVMYWLFGLFGMLAVALGAFYFIFQNNPAPEHADISVADTFTIIEEK